MEHEQFTIAFQLICVYLLISDTTVVLFHYICPRREIGRHILVCIEVETLVVFY